MYPTCYYLKPAKLAVPIRMSVSGYMKDVNAKIADWERNFHAWYPENQMGQADHARMMARELTSIYDALNDVREKLFDVADEFSAYNSNTNTNTNTSTVPNLSLIHI